MSNINWSYETHLGFFARTMLSPLFSIALLLHWACAQVAMPDLSNVTTAFSTAQIIPDVLQSFNPMDLVNVTFTDSVSMDSVDVVPGILLTMEQTAMQPDITLISSDSNAAATGNMSFVVALVDPDAPTPQNRSFAEFLHFLGGDFSADMTSGLLSNNSPALMEFTPPAPPAGSDPHRYVLLVFNQPDTFNTDGPMFVNASTPRSNFNVASFAQNVSLGNPIAGNYFLVGPMDSSAGASSTQMASATDQQPTPTAPFSIPADPSLTTFDTSPPAAVTAPSTTPSTSRGNSDKMRFKGPEIIAMTFMVILTSL